MDAGKLNGAQSSKLDLRTSVGASCLPAKSNYRWVKGFLKKIHKAEDSLQLLQRDSIIANHFTSIM